MIPFYYGSGSSSGSGTVINYGSGSGSDFLARYGSGSSSQKVMVSTVLVPVPVPQRCFQARGQTSVHQYHQWTVHLSGNELQR